MKAKFISIVLMLTVVLSVTFFTVPAKAAGSAASGNCENLNLESQKYFNEFKYAEFIDFLERYKATGKTEKACVNYYKALCRYTQLNDLEEKQLWDEYFASGNDYRAQLLESAQKALVQTNANDGLRSKARLLLWQFHAKQQDAFCQQALVDLITDVKAYAAADKDAVLIKQVADALLLAGDKPNARQLYALYVDKLLKAPTTDAELKNIAAGFYKEGNLELAQTFFDAYIQRAAKGQDADKFIAQLFEIASLFVYKPAGLYDLAYAEKIYALIESTSGSTKVFNQETIYLRAFNLEKMEDYKNAQKFYTELTQDYPDARQFQEAIYKIGMIQAYCFANLAEAQKYFQLLADKTPVTPHVVSSLYQLGLLAQWQGDLIKAGSYYDLLLKVAQDKFSSTVALASERINEIKEQAPISYNLKTFLDLSLKDGAILKEANQAQIKSESYIPEKNKTNAISTYANMPQSGCNQVVLQYLWSGNLGGAQPGVQEGSFVETYVEPGTKEINMVLISPAGTVDRSFTMVDVY